MCKEYKENIKYEFNLKCKLKKKWDEFRLTVGDTKWRPRSNGDKTEYTNGTKSRQDSHHESTVET